MNRKRNYSRSVRKAVIDYFDYNFHQIIDDDYVYNMEPKEVLRYFLEWEGIIGYDWDILSILTDENPYIY